MGTAQDARDWPSVDVFPEPAAAAAGIVRLLGRVVELLAETIVSHEATDHSVEMD